MSRAVNIDASRADVLAMCNRHDLRISAIEFLHPVGTRVVLYNLEDSATLTTAFAGKILAGQVTRQPLRTK